MEIKNSRNERIQWALEGINEIFKKIEAVLDNRSNDGTICFCNKVLVYIGNKLNIDWVNDLDLQKYMQEICDLKLEFDNKKSSVWVHNSNSDVAGEKKYLFKVYFKHCSDEEDAFLEEASEVASILVSFAKDTLSRKAKERLFLHPTEYIKFNSSKLRIGKGEACYSELCASFKKSLIKRMNELVSHAHMDLREYDTLNIVISEMLSCDNSKAIFDYCDIQALCESDTEIDKVIRHIVSNIKPIERTKQIEQLLPRAELNFYGINAAQGYDDNIYRYDNIEKALKQNKKFARVLMQEVNKVVCGCNITDVIVEWKDSLYGSKSWLCFKMERDENKPKTTKSKFSYDDICCEVKIDELLTTNIDDVIGGLCKSIIANIKGSRQGNNIISFDISYERLYVVLKGIRTNLCTDISEWAKRRVEKAVSLAFDVPVTVSLLDGNSRKEPRMCAWVEVDLRNI